MAKSKKPQKKDPLDPRVKAIGEKLRKIRIKKSYPSYEEAAWEIGIN